MKKLICITIAVFSVFALLSCGARKRNANRICDYIWESKNDILQFTKDGKILRNFQSPEESSSYYKISENKINMYTEEGEEFGIVFDYKFQDDKLYIGKAEYSPYARVNADGTVGDGLSLSQAQADYNSNKSENNSR